jgi:hypothetical protein
MIEFIALAPFLRDTASSAQVRSAVLQGKARRKRNGRTGERCPQQIA